jgi:hypothetical protein
VVDGGPSAVSTVSCESHALSCNEIGVIKSL